MQMSAELVQAREAQQKAGEWLRQHFGL
jgi:hypothetical protein